jgi:hypothetical protein
MLETTQIINTLEQLAVEQPALVWFGDIGSLAYCCYMITLLYDDSAIRVFDNLLPSTLPLFKGLIRDIEWSKAQYVLCYQSYLYVRG